MKSNVRGFVMLMTGFSVGGVLSGIWQSHVGQHERAEFSLGLSMVGLLAIMTRIIVNRNSST